MSEQKRPRRPLGVPSSLLGFSPRSWGSLLTPGVLLLPLVLWPADSGERGAYAPCQCVSGHGPGPPRHLVGTARPRGPFPARAERTLAPGLGCRRRSLSSTTSRPPQPRLSPDARPAPEPEAECSLPRQSKRAGPGPCALMAAFPSTFLLSTYLPTYLSIYLPIYHLPREWNSTVFGFCVRDWLIPLSTSSSGLTQVMTCVGIPSFLRLDHILLSHFPTHSPGVGAHAASPFPPRCPERLCAQVCEHPRVLCPARWLSPSVSDLPGGFHSTGGRRPPAPWAPRRKCPCGRVGSKLRLLCRPSPWTASRREPLGRPSAAGGLAPALPTRGPGGALPAASLRWPVALAGAVINPRERDRREGTLARFRV